MKALILASPRDSETWPQVMEACGYSSHHIARYRPMQLHELNDFMSEYGLDTLICSMPDMVAKIFDEKSANLDDWAGTCWPLGPGFENKRILVLPPWWHYYAVNHAPYTFKLYLSKLANPRSYQSKAYLYKEDTLDGLDAAIDASDFMSVDIENPPTNDLTMIGFHPNKSTHAYIINNPFTGPHASAIRELLASSIPKCFANGTYDNFHLLRYQTPVRNYILDTEYYWHAYQPELLKRLAFLSGLLLPVHKHWKQMSSTNMAAYNARDCFNTTEVMEALLRHMPDWALKQATDDMELMPPCVLGGHTAIEVDETRRLTRVLELEEQKEGALAKLRIMSDNPEFNPGSYKQLQEWLYDQLGFPAQYTRTSPKRITTGAKALARLAATQGALASKIIVEIFKYREADKLIGTYYNARLYKDKYWLFALNLDGTETGRLSSNASQLRSVIISETPKKRMEKREVKNLGGNIQNTPPEFRTIMKAPDNWTFGKIDLGQTEARWTAYLSGDPDLIVDLETPDVRARYIERTEHVTLDNAAHKDFYCLLVYIWFKIVIHKKHPLRKLIKSIIHGTNYMMGAETFIDTVGIVNLLKYMNLLGWRGSLLDFASMCLSLYHKTYPRVQKWWADSANFVAKNGYLETPDGRRRIFHGKALSHTTKKEIVAHGPQHSNVAAVNLDFIDTYKYGLANPETFRLITQIHDELLFLMHDESIDIHMQSVAQIMTRYHSVNEYTFTIPLEGATGKYWGEMREYKV